MNRKIIVSAVMIIIIMIFGLGMMKFAESFKQPDEAKKEVVSKLFVEAEKIHYGDVKTNVTASGRLTSREIVNLTPEVAGKILSGDLPLKTGQSFRKGQILARIYDKNAKLDLQARKSRFLTSVANLLPDFKVDFPDSYDTWKKFFSDININKDLPAIPDIRSDREKIYLAGRNILADYFTIKSSELIMSKYTLYAPFDGAYTDVTLEPGAVAGAGTRIAGMIRTDKLEVEIPVKKVDAEMLKVGGKAMLTDEEGNEYNAVINRIADFVNPQTQSVTVYLSLSGGSSNALYNGSYVNAVFPGIVVKDAMEIPRAAVFNHNEVFLVLNGKIKKRTINILHINENTLLFNGPMEGSYVVSEALINAKENTQTEIIGLKLKTVSKSNSVSTTK